MSVSLRCPNCGNVIGEASHEDNYVDKYYHKNDKGEPICNLCGAGGNSTDNFGKKVFIIAIIGITIIMYFCFFN